MDENELRKAISGVYRVEDYAKEEYEAKENKGEVKMTDARAQPWRKYIAEISAVANDEQVSGDRYMLFEGYDDHSS